MSVSARGKALLTRFASFLARLWHGTRKRLRHYRGTTSLGERTVAVGGNVEHSRIQTGDTYNISFDPDELRTLVMDASERLELLLLKQEEHSPLG